VNMSHRYDVEVERHYIDELERLKKMNIVNVIMEAVRRCEETLEGDPWTATRFVVSEAGGIADYFYDIVQGVRFRAPTSAIVIAIKHGDVAILPTKIVRREKAISELKRMLENARKELESIERKLKKRRSSFLEEQKRLWQAEVERITRALEYLSTT